MRQVRRLLFAALMSAASQDAMVLIPMALALCGFCLAGQAALCVLCLGRPLQALGSVCYVLCAMSARALGALRRRRSQ